MKKFIYKSALFCLIMLLLVSGITSFVLFAIPLQFEQSYQHALSLQFDSMKNLTSPKLVVMGDSSVPFSLNVPLMEKKIRMPVQTLGIHSGTGLEYILSLSKGSIRKGDVMVLELVPSNVDSFTPGIVLTACENNFDMYRAFGEKDWKKVAEYYPSYLIKKIKYFFHIRDKQSPSYSRKSFDSNGNYDYSRTRCELPKPLPSSSKDTVFNKKDYNSEFVSYLRDYDRLCRERGATFLITFPPFLDESLVSSPKDMSDLIKYLTHELNVPIITKITDRALPRKYMFNNVTHCNTAGANKVTNDLANDIQRYFSKKTPDKFHNSLSHSVPSEFVQHQSLRAAPKLL
jgi:hypothetical protein